VETERCSHKLVIVWANFLISLEKEIKYKPNSHHWKIGKHLENLKTMAPPKEKQ